MNVIEYILWYVAAMQFANKRYGRAKFQTVKDEWNEFLEKPSFEELADTIHSIIRMTGSPYLGLIIWPCVRKFALRYKTYGDIVSERQMRNRGIEVPSIH